MADLNAGVRAVGSRPSDLRGCRATRYRQHLSGRSARVASALLSHWLPAPARKCADCAVGPTNARARYRRDQIGHVSRDVLSSETSSEQGSIMNKLGALVRRFDDRCGRQMRRTNLVAAGIFALFATLGTPGPASAAPYPDNGLPAWSKG